MELPASLTSECDQCVQHKCCCTCMDVPWVLTVIGKACSMSVAK